MDRAALEARYLAALEEALARQGAPALPAWMRPRLPAAIAEGMLAAQALLGALPAPLAEHYLERAPREWVAQRLRGRDAAGEMLWRPLEGARLPGLCAALDGACEILRKHAIEPRLVLGAGSAAELLAGKPCALELIAGALLACGLPLLGAGEAERRALSRALAATGAQAGPDAADHAQRDAAALLDRHLGQHLAHELLHGRAPAEKMDGAAPTLLRPPWLLREAAALWLQARAHPRHVFPAVAGEAVPGVSLFVLAGEGLAAALGAGALLSVLSEPERFAERFGPGLAKLLALAEWQEWLSRPRAPFAQDALRAEAWIKLAAAARLFAERGEAGGTARGAGEDAPEMHERSSERREQALEMRGRSSELRESSLEMRGGSSELRRSSIEARALPLAGSLEMPPALRALGLLFERAAAADFARAARELPSLLDAAEAVPWPALPGWQREPSAEDGLRARTALRALFQENALAPIFVTRPAELPDPEARIVLEPERCRVRASPRPEGRFAEPARWIFPPPLCRLLYQRGLRRLVLRGAMRADCAALADGLVALAKEGGPLGAELALDARALAELVRTRETAEESLPAGAEGRWTSSPR